jgi:peptide/nickel transport system substrate-binding protein
MRKALLLSLDRQSFIDILGKGEGIIGGAMLPPPHGVWGMPPEVLETVAGFSPNTKANRAEARKIMEGFGYGPDNRLKMKVSTRNTSTYRNAGIVLIDHLKEIYIDAELETIESGEWYGKVARKDYSVGMNFTGSGVDDPDSNFYENYSCGSQRNYTGYCNKELEKLFAQQSMEADVDKRKALVWEIDKRLQEDGARPIIFHSLRGTCHQPHLKGLTVMSNSAYNGWRFEDVWLDK